MLQFYASWRWGGSLCRVSLTGNWWSDQPAGESVMNWPIVRILAAATLLAAFPWGQPAKPSNKLVRFHRVSEPREGAFTMLVPDGWRVQGGVYRVDPSR